MIVEYPNYIPDPPSDNYTWNLRDEIPLFGNALFVLYDKRRLESVIWIGRNTHSTGRDVFLHTEALNRKHTELIYPSFEAAFADVPRLLWCIATDIDPRNDPSELRSVYYDYRATDL